MPGAGGNGFSVPVSRHYVRLPQSSQGRVGIHEKGPERGASATRAELCTGEERRLSPPSWVMKEYAMSRIGVWVGVVLAILAANTVGVCQVAQPMFPGYRPGVNPCGPQARSEPVVRTVQVDVPVPCVPPAGCVPVTARLPYPCCPPPCPPPCPTRPVKVQVDVVVRPEAPKPCVPERLCCENPPVLEPIVCQAVALVQSVIAAPLALGELFMAHPVPKPMPVPRPVPCWLQPAAMPSACVPQPPVAQCVPPCPPLAWCGPPGPPAKVKARDIPGPAATWTPRRNAPFPR